MVPVLDDRLDRCKRYALVSEIEYVWPQESQLSPSNTVPYVVEDTGSKLHFVRSNLVIVLYLSFRR